MAKGDNYGLPKDILDQCMVLFSNPIGPPPIQEVDCRAGLIALIHEEYAAAHPGTDIVGVLEVQKAFDDVKAAFHGVQGVVPPTPANVNPKVADLIKAINEVTKKWKIGPVGFFTVP